MVLQKSLSGNFVENAPKVFNKLTLNKEVLNQVLLFEIKLRLIMFKLSTLITKKKLIHVQDARSFKWKNSIKIGCFRTY